LTAVQFAHTIIITIMFAAKAIRSVAVTGSRNYGRGTAPLPHPVREVMVSQSRDLARNTALEDWAAKNVDLHSKNILILTNNLSLSPTNETVLDIKATLLDCSVCPEKAAEFEEMVLSSLPPSLLLSSLPDLERGRTLLEPGALGHTVRLELDKGVGAKAVLEALHSIAKAFLKDHTVKRFGLVRPDDGWFQGLEATRTELESRMTSSSKALSVWARKEARRGARVPRTGGGGREGFGLQNSYGI